jgi:allantoicase
MEVDLPIIDLASRWLGASVLAASDESFGEKENLLTPGPAAFVPGRYNYRGEIVDGWETRRRRQPGHDWAIVRLGCPGVITSIDVDTSFFTGNYPETCVIEACGREGYPSPHELLDAATEWVEIAPRSALKGDTHNVLDVNDPQRFTHVKLTSSPDGGIARLRVYGHAVPDPRVWDGLSIDLASQEHGGVVIESSDGFYTSASNLNRPDRARTMGEGWETRRRRDDGHDHAIIQLALPGKVQVIEIDTAHFKYNASGAVAVTGRLTESSSGAVAGAWVPLLPNMPLQPDTCHTCRVLKDVGTVSAIRLDVFPDGGLSRIRAWGHPDPGARRRTGYRWFNTLPIPHALQCLAALGVRPLAANDIVSRRPMTPESLHDVAKNPSRDLDMDTIARLKTMIEG